MRHYGSRTAACNILQKGLLTRKYFLSKILMRLKWLEDLTQEGKRGLVN